MKKLLISLVLCLVLITMVAVPAMAAKGSNYGSIRVPIVGTNGLNYGSAMVNNAIEPNYTYNTWDNAEISLSFKNLNSNFTYYFFWIGADAITHGEPLAFTTNSKGNYNWSPGVYISPGTYTWNFVLADNYRDNEETHQFYFDPSEKICSTGDITITTYAIPPLPPSP
jgi:hypothetical protein